jgi:GT2 family glycosyltransferase
MGASAVKTTRLTLSVIVPVHDGAGNLARCLTALNASTEKPYETIVVDDASADGSAQVARGLGARVIAFSNHSRGPGFARNRGAAEAHGDVLVFCDADVVVRPDTLTLIHQRLAEQPGVAALFGSYDDDPPDPRLASRYKNLLHHYVHQHGQPEAITFWAGCGAIRREAFVLAGGFDECYARPSIEDIELGMRLRRLGLRVRLCPDIQVTHLKAWTLTTLWRSDLLDRAIPWTRLILHEPQVPDDLNLNVKSRLSALLIWGGLVFLFSVLFVNWAWLGTVLATLGVIGLNWDLYRFFARRGGVSFAMGAVFLHVLYLAYSSAVFGVMWMARQMQKLIGSVSARVNHAGP